MGDYFTDKTIKLAEYSMLVLGILILGITWFNVCSNWVSEENMAHVDFETQVFLDNCSKTGTIDKESFIKLCEVAKENKVKIKMNVNSKDLTFDQNNPPENLCFSNKDYITIFTTGVGRNFVEVLKHDHINGQPIKDFKYANIV